MRSKTSFFNPTLFWNNVRRFWPLWAGYLAVWILILPLPLLMNFRGTVNISPVALRARLLSTGYIGGTVVGAVVAVFSAMLVWNFLYHPRTAHGYACLPLRREALYFSGVLSGFLPLLAANLVIALLALLSTLLIGCPDPLGAGIWFAIDSLILLFFYGFSTLCAQLTGHILVLPAVYAVLNFVFVGVESLLRAVFSNFIYGMPELGIGWFQLPTRWLSPAIGMASRFDVDYVYVETAQIRRPVAVRFQGWGVLLAYAIAGLAMLALALWLLRWRKMESAGDVVAIKVLKPVFRWCMGLGCGLVLCAVIYAIAIIWSGYYLDAKLAIMTGIAFLGAFVGWFGAEMLMKKSFRVFRKPLWGGYGLCCLAMALAVLGMRLDLTGYEKRLPDASQVERVLIQINGESAVLSSPEGVARTLALHRAVIEDKDWNRPQRSPTAEEKIGRIPVTFHYFLGGEKMFVRSYSLAYDIDGSYGSIKTGSRGEMPELARLMNAQEAINQRKSTFFPFTRDNIYYGQITAALPLTECARLAEREGPEEYILMDLRGFTADELARMDGAERRSLVAQGILDNCRNGYALAEALGSYTDEEGYNYQQAIDALAAARLDYSGIFADYIFSFTMPEFWELYSECVLPDIAEGSLGRVWVLTDEHYADTVYAARIEIGARERNPDVTSPRVVNEYGLYPTDSGDGYDHASFYTVPTVDSYRTVRWLNEHGVALYTEGESGSASGGLWKQ
ncbi:MAG: hypothetical protein IJ617_07385 [Oscillospiraceae bacterium]|nr:hypothetical protein [Oscillospiraceae bacterium]